MFCADSENVGCFDRFWAILGGFGWFWVALGCLWRFLAFDDLWANFNHSSNIHWAVLDSFGQFCAVVGGFGNLSSPVHILIGRFWVILGGFGDWATFGHI